jgi:hypothetical protein
MLGHIFGVMARLVSAVGVCLTARDKHDREEALPSSERALEIQRGGD